MDIQRIIDRLQRIVIKLYRWKYVLGFGIQSPSAYSFVRYVINEHYPYYAYQDLKEQHPSLLFKVRHLAKLYFRMANFFQPKSILVEEPFLHAKIDYLRAGCQNARICTFLDSNFFDSLLDSVNGRFDMAILSSPCNKPTLLQALLEKARPNSVLIVENIHADSHSKLIWHKLVSHPLTGVCYDLYYCGIILFDHSKNKQLYLINF